MDILESKFNTINDDPEIPEEKLEYIRRNQERIAKELISDAEEEIGKGNSARVYIDPEYPDLCYKRITKGVNVNTPPDEAKFLEAVRVIESDIKIPLPVMTISFDYEHDGETLHCNALAMERINGMTLEEISNTGKFPEGVEPSSKKDLEKFRDNFTKLRKFVEEMNGRLGIYHTDIKERNIMLDKHGDWWLIDFGEAHREHFQQEVGYTDKQDLDQTWKKFALFATGYIENLQD